MDRYSSFIFNNLLSTSLYFANFACEDMSLGNGCCISLTISNWVLYSLQVGYATLVNSCFIPHFCFKKEYYLYGVTYMTDHKASEVYQLLFKLLSNWMVWICKCSINLIALRILAKMFNVMTGNHQLLFWFIKMITRKIKWC